MPKRVIDFDAMWASDKIAACAEWAQAEYAWLYGMADCAGCFELTNLRVIWGRVSAVRRNFSLERLQQVLDEFQDKGLLFVWNESGKRYGHWTGSDVPGRLPPPSWRNRLERLAPPLPREQFLKYVAEHSAGIKNKLRCEPLPDGTSAACGRELQAPIEFGAGVARVEPVGRWRDERSTNCSTAETVSACPPSRANAQTAPDECESSRAMPLKAGLELPQAQDLGLDREGNRERELHTNVSREEKSVCDAAPHFLEQKQKLFDETSKANAQSVANSGNAVPYAGKGKPASEMNATPESLFEIWEQERGPLAELRGFSPERAARCRERISHARSKSKSVAQFFVDFREAVARAAKTPFLCGSGPAGWCANFDWLIANNTNYLKVLEGRYDAGAGSSTGANAAAPGATNDACSTSGDSFPSWTARSIARDEAVRRELNAGTGPSTADSSTRIRAGVIDRALHRQ